MPRGGGGGAQHQPRRRWISSGSGTSLSTSTLRAAASASWDAGEVASRLSSHVYVSIDLDVLDPSLMPAVGTPEPGGMDWNAVIELLRGGMQGAHCGRLRCRGAMPCGRASRIILCRRQAGLQADWIRNTKGLRSLGVEARNAEVFQVWQDSWHTH